MLMWLLRRVLMSRADHFRGDPKYFCFVSEMCPLLMTNDEIDGRALDVVGLVGFWRNRRELEDYVRICQDNETNITLIIVFIVMVIEK